MIEQRIADSITAYKQAVVEAAAQTKIAEDELASFRDMCRSVAQKQAKYQVGRERSVEIGGGVHAVIKIDAVLAKIETVDPSLLTSGTVDVRKMCEPVYRTVLLINGMQFNWSHSSETEISMSWGDA
jgi:hypothetical protein